MTRLRSYQDDTPNKKITGANMGGPRQLAIWMHWATHVAQFWRWPLHTHEHMKTHTSRIAACCLMFLFTSFTLMARDAARDLRRMKGFTIIDAATVSGVVTSKFGDKIVKLDNGTAYKVQLLLLDPLTLTDVIVFAKAPSKELREKTDKKIPDSALYQFKLLIDNEAYDATPVRLE